MENKIKMPVPLVEINGDEMTRVIWGRIKEILLKPYIELNTEYYDLGLINRNETGDQISIDAANAIKKYGVGVKCSTITPNKARMKEYNLTQMWRSPNGTIRAILDGTVFRRPIVIDSLKPLISTWAKPITIARHAYGDVYRNVEYKVQEPGKAELVFTSSRGEISRQTIFDFKKPGVILGMHNLDNSIESFARACFNYALDVKEDLWFSCKDTICKIYDQAFKDIFQQIYENDYKEKYEAAGIEYSYTLIDDTVSRIIRSNGGIVWACQNYDGDIMSDMIATVFGSSAMMTSVLVSPEGYHVYEPTHGTIQKHYYNHLKGMETSTNCMSTLFAWTGALRKRGELDNSEELISFLDKLEKASIQTINEGYITKDLVKLSCLSKIHVVTTEEFISEIKKRLDFNLFR